MTENRIAKLKRMVLQENFLTAHYELMFWKDVDRPIVHHDSVQGPKGLNLRRATVSLSPPSSVCRRISQTLGGPCKASQVPHHCYECTSGLVHALPNSSRGAIKKYLVTTIRSISLNRCFSVISYSSFLSLDSTNYFQFVEALLQNRR